jgi:hypothetical protein
MSARFAMWVHGVSAYPERTAGDAGVDGPLLNAWESVTGPGVPHSEITGFRQGYGATFRGKAFHNNWIHFEIPAPVIVPGIQTGNQPGSDRVIHLEKVFVLYKNYVSAQRGALARIEQVDVWDGGRSRYLTRLVPAPPFSEDNPSRPPPSDDVPPDPEPLPFDPYGGDHHLDIQRGWNMWTITDGVNNITPLIRWGICISVLVHFSAEIEIRFAAAGADFLVEMP